MFTRVALLIAIAAAPLHAGRFLIVDPGDTETGRLFERVAREFAPDPIVRRVQFAQIVEALRDPWDAVVWLDPEPSLDDSVRPAWEKLLGDKSAGLMFIGLPHDQPGREALVAALKDRGGPHIGVHLSKHLETCHWIWTPGKTADNSHAYLRKRFELKEIPARAWIQVAADNRSRVQVNGKDVGQSDDWRRPSSFDVKSILRAGENVIAVDAFNEDGPAGVVLSLTGSSASGEVVLDIKSDASWKASSAPVDRWSDSGFNDSTWPAARAIAILGEGPWESKVRSDYLSDEHLASFTGSKHQAISNLTGAVGQIVILDALKPGPECATVLADDQIPIALAGEGPNGRMILVGGSFERTTPGKGLTDVLDSQGLKAFMASSIAWLAHTSAPNITSMARNAESTPLRIEPLKPEDRDKFLPIAMQFTPLPHDGLPDADSFPTRQAALRRMIDNMIDHGVTTLHVPVQLPPEQAVDVESYAQSRGMMISAWWFEHPAEIFNRKQPPPVPLDSPEYQELVRKRVSKNLDAVARFPRLQAVWAFQDEPFHHGPDSFVFSNMARLKFLLRFGHELPVNLNAAKGDARSWLDFLNFQSDLWPAGWRTSYKLIKQANPNFIAAANHDSHNTFGGSAQQEGPYNVDDVFHWGGDWADMYTFDIYPYLMSDFRYGPNRKLKLPRMAQTHFALAQMRNLTTSFNKKLGFWVGTYNPEWYDLPKEGRAQYWMEREMAYTAVANGADFLIGGIGIPIDQHHWDDVGQSMKTLAKVGPQLLKAPKLRARAAMFFPRTQILLTQEEYWNVAQSYEAFLRAFGELDVIHEDQILSGNALDNYEALVLFDVKLIPRAAAEKIAKFVEGGGIVIADCVANEDENRKSLDTMEKLFGVRDSSTDRILWKIVKKKDDPDVDADLPASRPAAEVRFVGNPLGVTCDIPLVSPRGAVVTGGETLAKTTGGKPALIRASRGKGKSYLLGFCLQDTMFQTYQANDAKARQQLLSLLAEITADAGIRSHAWSSNPSVEVAVRGNPSEAFVFVISHEASEPKATVRVRDVPFTAGRIVDVETDREVPAKTLADGVEFEVGAPTGATQILHITPR